MRTTVGRIERRLDRITRERQEQKTPWTDLWEDCTPEQEIKRLEIVARIARIEQTDDPLDRRINELCDKIERVILPTMREELEEQEGKGESNEHEQG